MQRRNFRVAWALTGAIIVAAALIPASAFATGDDSLASSPRSDWAPTDGRGDVEESFQGSRTVPHWTSSFTDPTNHVTYPFTIVGSDPRLGGSTTVDTVIIPLTFKFVAGSQDVSMLTARGYVAATHDMSMNGADDVAATVASPIFTPANFPISGDSGVQYGDAMMRAQFGKVGTDYHVNLGQPKILKPVSISVPQDKGVAVFNPLGVLTGIVDATWFKERLRHAIDERHVDSTTLPIFLSHNVFLYQDGNYLHCCTVGGHGAGSPTSTAPVVVDGQGRKPVHTFVFAAYITPNSFRNPGLSDINSLSHEISEWTTNPFGGNMVQPYRVPLAPPGTCGSALETGDVVAGIWFPMPGNPNAAAGGVWHPQDEAFLNWFARNGEAAGLAPADGRFTYMGVFGLPAQAC